MVSHQATTPSTSAIATAGMRRWRDSQNAQIANAAKPGASKSTSPCAKLTRQDPTTTAAAKISDET